MLVAETDPFLVGKNVNSFRLTKNMEEDTVLQGKINDTLRQLRMNKKNNDEGPLLTEEPNFQSPEKGI
jgi:hypothetical protein